MTRLRTLGDSYRVRLIAGYVLVAVVFSAAWLWSMYGPLTSAILGQQQRNLAAVAQSGALVAAETSATPDLLARRLVARTDLRVTIVSSDGVVLADSEFDPERMENHSDRPEIAAALQGREGSDRRLSRTQRVEELYVAVPATLAGKRVALRVSQPLNEITEIARRSRRLGLALIFAALVIASLAASRLSAAAAQPVEALTASAHQMARGNLQVDVPQVSGELSLLSDALTSLKRQMRSRIEALEAEQVTLRTTLDGITDAVFLLEEGIVRIANSAASLYFEAPAGGWPGRPLSERWLPASLAHAIAQQLATGEATASELGPDPAGRTYRLTTVPLDSAETARSLVTVADITERATLDQVRRDFVANASHELKTPVAGIQLLASSARTAARDGDTEQAVTFAVQIEAEAERLRRLVSDLLDLSRLEDAARPGALTDIRHALDLALTGHHGAAARKGLELHADLSEIRGIDVYVTADPTDVAVALDNLLDNAIAYTDAGHVSASVTAEADEVLISVSDSGPGIAPEHLSRIFERFYRVDRGRAREAGGTGLGLALVRNVAERAGGTVSVESQIGRGSTFTLVLPRAR